MTIGQQHIVQNRLQTRLRFALEEDVVRKGPVQICPTDWRISWDTDGSYWRSQPPRRLCVTTWLMMTYVSRGGSRNATIHLIIDITASCCTCVDGFFQFGLVLHGQQRLVITRVFLQVLLGTAGCHPDPGAVLVRHTFAHVPLHFQNTFCI